MNINNPSHANQYCHQYRNDCYLFKSMIQINESRSDNKELHINTKIPRLRHLAQKIEKSLELAKFYVTRNEFFFRQDTLEHLQHLARRIEKVVYAMKEIERNKENLEIIFCNFIENSQILQFPFYFHSFVYEVMLTTNAPRNVQLKTKSNTAKRDHCRENGTPTLLQA